MAELRVAWMVGISGAAAALVLAACGSTERSPGADDVEGGADASSGSPGTGAVRDAASQQGHAAAEEAGGSDRDGDAGPEARPDAALASCADAGACRDAGPFCDAASGACVPCLTRDDCGPRRACVAGRCVAVTPCRNSSQCTDASLPRCHPGTGTCVACLLPADCNGGERCVNGECVPYTPCTNSLDCGNDQVCDQDDGSCAECLMDADCGEGRKCAGNACSRTCESDLACTPLGLLCHHALGYCTECLNHADCASSEHCEQGRCRPDLCAPGEAYCSDGNYIIARNLSLARATAPA